MRNLITGVVVGAVIGGVIGTIASEEIYDVKNMIKREFPDDAEKIIDKIFFENANELFFNGKIQGERVSQPPKAPAAKSGKVVWAIGVGTLVTALTFALFNKNKTENNQEKHLSMVV